MKSARRSTPRIVSPSFRHWSALLRHLDADLSSIQTIDPDRSVVTLYKELLKRLRSMEREELLRTLPSLAAENQPTAQKDTEISDEAAASLPVEEVMLMLEGTQTPKAILETVARARFKVPSGSLNRLSRDALVNKILTLARNEKGHESIRKIIKSQSS